MPWYLPIAEGLEEPDHQRVRRLQDAAELRIDDRAEHDRRRTALGCTIDLRHERSDLRRVIDEGPRLISGIETFEPRDQAVREDFGGDARVVRHTEHPPRFTAHDDARASQVSSTVSGFNEMLSMPSSTSHLAKSR
jgi:hypothetical protein